jgi:hypothetical protein
VTATPANVAVTPARNTRSAVRAAAAAAPASAKKAGGVAASGGAASQEKAAAHMAPNTVSGDASIHAQ